MGAKGSRLSNVKQNRGRIGIQVIKTFECTEGIHRWKEAKKINNLVMFLTQFLLNNCNRTSVISNVVYESKWIFQRKDSFVLQSKVQHFSVDKRHRECQCPDILGETGIGLAL